MKVISLGWGVQSFTMACMSALGDLPEVDYAIHADTGYERESTYKLAAQFTPWLNEHGVRVETVKCVRNDVVMAQWSNSVMIPAFTLDNQGNKGQLRRQCTHDWKVMPVRRFVKERLSKHSHCEMWLGISVDEAGRMRDSDVKFVDNWYPLIEMKMTRADCVTWLKAHDLPVPDKSACVFCPYHNRKQWEDLKIAGGKDWETAVKVDEDIRDKRGGAGFPLFVHGKRVPLTQAVHTAEDDGAKQAEMFTEDECEGYCFI